MSETTALAAALHDKTCIHDDYGIECESGARGILAALHEQGYRIVREDALPKAADLRGLAPDITGGLSSEEYVRRMRDES